VPELSAILKLLVGKHRRGCSVRLCPLLGTQRTTDGAVAAFIHYQQMASGVEVDRVSGALADNYRWLAERCVFQL
jgi:hypothetical protein